MLGAVCHAAVAMLGATAWGNAAWPVALGNAFLPLLGCLLVRIQFHLILNATAIQQLAPGLFRPDWNVPVEPFVYLQEAASGMLASHTLCAVVAVHTEGM